MHFMENKDKKEYFNSLYFGVVGMLGKNENNCVYEDIVKDSTEILKSLEWVENNIYLTPYEKEKLYQMYRQDLMLYSVIAKENIEPLVKQGDTYHLLYNGEQVDENKCYIRNLEPIKNYYREEECQLTFIKPDNHRKNNHKNCRLDFLYVEPFLFYSQRSFGRISVEEFCVKEKIKSYE